MKVEKEIPAKNATAAFNALKTSLTSAGWAQKTDGKESCEFEKGIGDTKTPELHKVTWIVRARKTKTGILAEIDVPLFEDWHYSRKRVEKQWNPVQREITEAGR